ncbi:MAG: tetraacyldisaccharide 4'-kinase [Vicinamibacterales bacterium]
MLATLYAAAASARRAYYQAPGRQRRLERPVISVGNLRVGGTGKTPAVAHVARILLEMGEQPAILSRGYRRRSAPDGVVVVSDGRRLSADLDRSGDEPLMLARGVEGARVLVASDRYLAGRLAETRLGATVHVLDDGFQHLTLARGTDLLIVGEDDLADARTLPAGQLREPLAAASNAHAVLVVSGTRGQARTVAASLGVASSFQLVREPGEPRRLDLLAASAPAQRTVSVLAVAGVARPERFFEELRSAGWDVKQTVAFPDHHRYTRADAASLADTARSSGARAIMTTEKDLVRLLPFRPIPLPLMWLPLTVRIDPAPAFRAWLAGRLAAERSQPRGVPA